MEREAMFYSKKDNGFIACELCPHGCNIGEGGTGLCRTRGVNSGELRAFNYGEVSSLAVDPIEKKPLYHYRPGSHILSVGSYGCNLRCGFCQNYHISMEKPKTEFIEPGELLRIAVKAKNQGSIGIAFTYNEPSIWYEYVYDVAENAKKYDIDIVLVTNGFIELKPLKKLLPYVNAMNIDLKAYNSQFYERVCGGNLEDVKKVIEEGNKECHVEITTLLVNEYNDSMEEVEELSSWISSINRNIPLHLSRYFPSYKFDAPATPESTILNCVKAAKKHLNYVYPGNLSCVDSNTYCPVCGFMVVERKGYGARALINNKCPKCNTELNIVINKSS